MTDRPDISAQVDAVESQVLSRQGFLDRCDVLMQDPKHRARLEYEYACTKGSQPALEAALDSLRWLKANRADFLAFVAERRAA